MENTAGLISSRLRADQARALELRSFATELHAEGDPVGAIAVDAVAFRLERRVRLWSEMLSDPV